MAPIRGARFSAVTLPGHTSPRCWRFSRNICVRPGVDPDSIAGFFGLSGPYALEPNTAELDEIFTSRATPTMFQPVQQVSERAPPALLARGAADFREALTYAALAAALRARVSRSRYTLHRSADTWIRWWRCRARVTPDSAVAGCGECIRAQGFLTGFL